MIYLMNSAVMPAGNYGSYEYAPATMNDLKMLMSGKIGTFRSCIGYPQNADLIEKWTGFRPEISRTETRFSSGDRAFVMRLKYRVGVGTKGSNVSEDPADWEFAWVLFSRNEGRTK